MSESDKNIIDETASTDEVISYDEMTYPERFFTWCKENWKPLIIGVAVLHSVIFIIVIATANSSNSPSEIVADPPQQPPLLVAVDDTDVINDELTDDAGLTAALEAGIAAGEMFITSKDALIDFLKGFDEATGATDWAKEHLESGLDWFNAWLEENYPNDNDTDSNLTSSGD